MKAEIPQFVTPKEQKRADDMHRSLLASAFLLTTVLAGCVSSARIAVPPDIMSSTEELKLAGMGGWQDGHFRLGASEGQFSRRSVRTKIMGALVRNSGGGSFEVTGPEVGGTAGGRCGFDEGEIDAKVAVVPNGRLTYRCDFHREGRPVDGHLMLAEVPNGRGIFAGRTRAGELRLGGLIVGIRPIHDSVGGGLPPGTPLGYAFLVEGRQIGAVDLNGTGKTIYVPRKKGPERDAVLMASLAMSVFWDPGA